MSNKALQYRFLESMRDTLYICQSSFSQAIQRCEDLDINPQIPLVVLRTLVNKNLEYFYEQVNDMPEEVERVTREWDAEHRKLLKDGDNPYKMLEYIIEEALESIARWEQRSL